MSTALISSVCTGGRRLTGLGLVLGLGVTGLVGTTATAADAPSPEVTQATDSAAAAGVEVTTTRSFASPRTLSIQTQTGAAGKAPSVQHTGDFRVLDTTLPGKPGVVGVRWSGEDTPIVQIRVRTADGWQDWVEADVEPGDNSSGEMAFGGDAVAAQVRVSAQAQSPEAMIITSEVTETDRQVVQQMGNQAPVMSVAVSVGGRGPAGLQPVEKTSDSVDVPMLDAMGLADSKPHAVEGPIIGTRQMWGAPEEDVTWTPRPATDVRAQMTHHAVTTNNYTRAEVPSIMRGINYWMVHGRNWGGFGYQVVVDRFGQAWQGRSGPLADMPIGAHVSGMNSKVMGVSMMGTFTNVLPTKEQWGATALVSAWQLRANDIDPNGRWSWKSKYIYPDGGGTYDTIMAHQEVANKDCPGYAVMAVWDDYQSTVRSFAKKDLMAVQPVTAEGANSIEQSVQHSKQAFPKSGANTETVYLSHWKDRARGVLTARVAQRTGSPSLMVEKHNVLAGTAGELERLKAKKVVITSPVEEVSPQVEEQLRAMGLQVERMDTASLDQLSADLVDRGGWRGEINDFVIANGEGGYADMLTGGAAAIHDKSAMLMSNNRGLGKESLAQIAKHTPSTVTLVGGTSVIPASVEAQIKRVSPNTVIERVSGSNRFSTAADLAHKVWGAGGANDVVLLGALDYSPSTPSALHVAAASDAPILFTKTGCMPNSIHDTVRNLDSRVSLLAGDAADTDFSAGTTRCS